MTRHVHHLALATLLTFLVPALARGQAPAAQPDEPPPPPPGWTGSFGAGLALTQGNSDTSTVNVAYDVLRDTGSNVLFKSAGLYIRGESEGTRTTDRLSLDARVDRKLSERASLFGQLAYLSDEFKEIDYLASPAIGASYFLAKNERTELAVDGGVGMVWEKNAGRSVQTDGAVVAGQTFKLVLSETATFTERSSALWKMGDFDDGLYVFGVALAASVTTHTQIKAELLNTFKNRPPDDVKKNDVAVLLSFVYTY